MTSNTSNKTLWGIDLGGTKIEGIVIDKEAPEKVLCRERIQTEGDRGYEHVLDNICLLISKMQRITGKTAEVIGMGTPGTLDPHSGKLRGCNSQHLNGKSMDRDLETVLDMQVILENDANCFALAEARLGAAKSDTPDAKVVFGVIMGTGVGGGLVVNGHLISGANKIAGEWGHNHLDDSGGLCYCGKVGCVETVISGPAIENYYFSQSGTKLPLEEISRLSESGDSDAQITMKRLCHFFGKGIAGIVNVIDPDVIVIGGGVGNVDSLYSEGLKEVSKHIFAPTLKTRIVKPALGDSAGVFGAALLIR
jgi:predicted NBD/HSP70 family sugar kinase